MIGTVMRTAFTVKSGKSILSAFTSLTETDQAEAYRGYLVSAPLCVSGQFYQYICLVIFEFVTVERHQPYRMPAECDRPCFTAGRCSSETEKLFRSVQFFFLKTVFFDLSVDSIPAVTDDFDVIDIPVIHKAPEFTQLDACLLTHVYSRDTAELNKAVIAVVAYGIHIFRLESTYFIIITQGMDTHPCDL